MLCNLCIQHEYVRFSIVIDSRDNAIGCLHYLKQGRSVWIPDCQTEATVVEPVGTGTRLYSQTSEQQPSSGHTS